MTNTDTAGSAPRTVGSLCSGVGGLDLAIPGKLRWVAEKDEAASSILAAEHPDAPNLQDITTTLWSERDHHVDLLTSGDPCQSMSAAGRMLASADERFLWPYVIDAIRKVRPAEVFLENVQNLMSVPLLRGATDWRGDKGSVLKLRLDDLQAAGYEAKWMILGACAIGAPHHRHRWFLRARYVGADARPAERVVVPCGAPKGKGRILLPTPRARDYKGSEGMRLERDGGPDLTTVVQLLLPTPGGYDGSRGGPRDPAERRGGGHSINLEDAAYAIDLAKTWGPYAEAVGLWESIIGRPAPAPTVDPLVAGRRRRLNPALSEWMMGYPEGYLTSRLGRNDALRCAGNGVIPLQGSTAYDLLA